MNKPLPITRRNMFFVLHPVFALTGVADAIAGPLLPSLAQSFQLTDRQSGELLFWIFAGMSAGALLCRGNYARILTGGLIALSAACACFPWISRTILYPFVFFLGVSIGAPMTATSLFVGRNYPARRASTFALLNLTWSIGALLAPLLAAPLLAVSSWRAVYLVLAAAAGLSAIITGFTLRDSRETARSSPETTGLRNLWIVLLFALFFFFEVGLESMFGAWISTYLLRVTFSSLTLAAAATSFYWAGFLVSRGFAPLVLLRVRPGRLLQVALPVAFSAATLLVAAHSPILLLTGILLLGAALAPVYPLLLAAFFDRARHSADSRFVIALSGFGGSVFPWLAGWIASQTGSLRTGLVSGPVTVLAMIFMLPLLGVGRSAPADAASGGSHDPA